MSYLDTKISDHHVSKHEPHHDKTNKMAYAPSEDRSTWASAQSDQSLRCLHEESLGP